MVSRIKSFLSFPAVDNLVLLQTWKEEMMYVYAGMAKFPEEIDLV